jgi:hypothetical protein
MPSDLTGIARWECRLYTQPDPLPAGLSLAIAGGGVNELAAPNFRVTLPSPLAWDQTVVLATFSTFYLGGEILMGLGPSEPSSVNDPASPAYTGASPNSPWRRLTLATASGLMSTAPGVWAAYALNGGSWECYHHLVVSPWCSPLPAEPQSWGAIKGLYR